MDSTAMLALQNYAMDAQRNQYQQGQNFRQLPEQGQACSLPSLLEQSNRLRNLIAEYEIFGLEVPKGVTTSLEETGRLVRIKVAEDRELRLRAAKAEVERLRSEEDRRDAAVINLAKIEAEIAAAEGRPLPLSDKAVNG